MKSSTLFLLFFALSHVNAGCTSDAYIAEVPPGPDSSAVDTGSRPEASAATDASASCASSAECGEGHVCGFPESAGCGGRGTCLPAASPCTIQATAGCACDGTEVNTTTCNDSLPGGYTLKPLAYAGACLSCPGGMIDAGGVGSPCTKTAECNASELCAWPMSQSCSDKSRGTCVAMVEGCHCVPPPACGCDGMQAITGCSAFLPFGYSLSPFAHVGACTSDAGVPDGT